MAKVEVTGVAEGTTSLTVKSASDPTKSDTIEFEVLDIGVNVSSVPDRNVEIGKSVEVSATFNPDYIDKGATTVWDVVTKDDDENPVDNATATVDPTDPRKCTLTGVKSTGGTEVAVRCTLTYDGWSFSDKSGFNVSAPAKESLHFYYSGSEITETSLAAQAVHTIEVRSLPSGAVDKWKITDQGNVAVANVQTNGNFLEVTGVEAGETSCTVAHVDDDSITATLKITVTPPDLK